MDEAKGHKWMVFMGINGWFSLGEWGSEMSSGMGEARAVRLPSSEANNMNEFRGDRGKLLQLERSEAGPVKSPGGNVT
ncbi:MAG: hypothetical protein JRJ77_19180 [Deltaproteobacteria bacterium]|nr:hypothetical protein [Deltaproteobacteria bacterium]